jgi:superfamily I DNA/RNA helicase
MTQRIFVPRFTMRTAGIDVVGRSFRLRINYRTTLQIKLLADSVVAPGHGHERLDGAVSVYQGPKPAVCKFKSITAEAEYVADAIAQTLRSDDREAHDIAVFARTAPALEPFLKALNSKGVQTHALSREAPPDGHVRVGSMHRAKGLEFKSVFVVGVSAEAVPDPTTVQHLFEPAALEEAMERERQMLYVALTRARDDLTVTWTGKPSDFLPGLEKALTCKGSDR